MVDASTQYTPGVPGMFPQQPTPAGNTTSGAINPGGTTATNWINGPPSLTTSYLSSPTTGDTAQGYIEAPLLTEKGAGAAGYYGFQYANPSNFNDPNAAAIYKLIAQQFGSLPQAAPQITSPTMVGPASTFGGATIPNVAQSGATTIGPTQFANTPQLSPAAQYMAANVGGVAQAGMGQIAPQTVISGATIPIGADTAFQNAQANQINALAEMANGAGPNVAGLTAEQTAEANTKATEGMLASQRGASNPALAQRAAIDVAEQNSQAAAGIAAQTKLQQELAAQQQLTGALAGVRGQEQQIGTAGAQLAQTTQEANQQAINNATLQQAGLAQGASIANAGALNTAGLTQAQLEQQAAAGNAGAINTINQEQGQLTGNTNLANAASANSAMQYLASLQQANQQFNAGQTNQLASTAAGLGNAAGIASMEGINALTGEQGQISGAETQANLSAALQNQQLNNQEYNALLASLQGQNQTDISNMVAFNQLMAQEQLGVSGINAGVNINEANNQLGLQGAAIGAGGALLAGMMMMSDENSKNNINPGLFAIQTFMKHLDTMEFDYV